MVNIGYEIRVVGWLVGWFEFNTPFQHKYGYIRDEGTNGLGDE